MPGLEKRGKIANWDMKNSQVYFVLALLCLFYEIIPGFRRELAHNSPCFPASSTPIRVAFLQNNRLDGEVKLASLDRSNTKQNSSCWLCLFIYWTCVGAIFQIDLCVPNIVTLFSFSVQTCGVMRLAKVNGSVVGI